MRIKIYFISLFCVIILNQCSTFDISSIKETKNDQLKADYVLPDDIANKKYFKLGIIRFKTIKIPKDINLEKDDISNAAVQITSSILKYIKGIIPVDRTKLKYLLKEYELYLSGVLSSKKYNKVIDLSDTDYLLIGTINGLTYEINKNIHGSIMRESPVEYQGKIRYLLHVEIVDTYTSKVIWADSVEAIHADYNEDKEKIVPENIFFRALKSNLIKSFKKLNQYYFVKGKVVRLKGNRKFAQINIGANNDIEKDMVFEVYNLDKKNNIFISEKIGEIRIIKVIETQSWGLCISSLTNRIKIGNMVKVKMDSLSELKKKHLEIEDAKIRDVEIKNGEIIYK